MRRLLCNAIYWLIEPLLDRVEQGRCERNVTNAIRMTPEESASVTRLEEYEPDSAEAFSEVQAGAETPRECGRS
ncbi:MAG: hypothetical protein ABIO21_15455 [Pseudomonas sp.]